MRGAEPDMIVVPDWMKKNAVIPLDRTTVFFDGIFTIPQLNHPEGIAIDTQGNIWCGGERGEVFRIESRWMLYWTGCHNGRIFTWNSL